MSRVKSRPTDCHCGSVGTYNRSARSLSTGTCWRGRGASCAKPNGADTANETMNESRQRVTITSSLKARYHRTPMTIRILVLVILATSTVIPPPSLAASARQAAPAPGFADAVLGRWDLTVHGADGPYPSWLEVLLRKESELMGRFVGRFGSNRHVSEISYNAGELLVRIPVQYERNKSDLVLKGRLVGDRLEGTTEDESGNTLKWTGVGRPAPG